MLIKAGARFYCLAGLAEQLNFFLTARTLPASPGVVSDCLNIVMDEVFEAGGDDRRKLSGLSTVKPDPQPVRGKMIPVFCISGLAEDVII